MMIQILPLLKRTSLFILAIVTLTACDYDERQRPVLEYETRNPAESGSRFPSLYTEDGETLHMSWLSGIEEGIFALEFSSMSDGRWNEPQTVHVGGNFFANWADFPSIVTRDNEPVLHWLRRIEGAGPYAYDVQISFPGDEPRRWNHVTPHTDGTATEHGFVSMVPLDGDRVLAIWLDGRQTGHGGHEGEESGLDEAMTLRSAVVRRDGMLEHENVVDAAVCDCCQTGMTATEHGAVAVYRDRSEEEIRDISLVRYDRRSGEWSAPVRVHPDEWQIRGCPVNGPRVAASGRDVVVTWYTEAGDRKRVHAAWSSDGGATFGEPLVIDSGSPMGRVDVAASPEGAFYVSWMEQDNSLARIWLRKIENGSLQSDPVLIGSTDLERNSGFPRIAAMNDGIALAWTQTEPFMRVRTAWYGYELDALFETEGEEAEAS